jgi:hypothetical protein
LRARHANAGKTQRRASPLARDNKRVIFGSAIVVLAAVGVSIAGWTGMPFSHDTQQAGRGQQCASSYIGRQDSDVCADATGTVTVHDLTISGTPLAAIDDEAGGIALCSSVTLTNNSGEKQGYNTQDFKIQNPAGEVNSPDPQGIDGALQSGALGAGGTKTGKVCDERGARKGLYAVIYEPDLFGPERGVWLSQH